MHVDACGILQLLLLYFYLPSFLQLSFLQLSFLQLSLPHAVPIAVDFHNTLRAPTPMNGCASMARARRVSRALPLPVEKPHYSPAAPGGEAALFTSRSREAALFTSQRGDAVQLLGARARTSTSRQWRVLGVAG